MTDQQLQSQKEILGYKLKQKVGSGGYGEVWSAEAPGGLLKAVKVVFGYHDEKRAQAELKALQRVKDVRHPFLLSLERIDICDGQMVVVSELADLSLADYFNTCCEKTGQGIPRDELLGYMRDAADALDYLSNNHELQHLDVKPENLLLVAGHVKVADFGLVKDLRDVSQSLMTGLTPTYAAPEMFDGRPGQFTDQYSLAIVYTEMLTTQRPFPGTTPAQLAAQHMHGRPNLQALPTSDQAVIARALSKQPEQRFGSCREMIDELLKRQSRKKQIRCRTRGRSQEDSNGKTIAFDNALGRFKTDLATNAMDFRPTEFISLEPPEFENQLSTIRPTIVIGVGCTAGQAIQRMKQRLVARYGDMLNIPAIQLACLDCDREALAGLSAGDERESINANETIETPLKRPEDYREKGSDKFSWLSRRWLFNIPRTLQTEGLRPLGRLAFADHFDSICEALHRKLSEVTDIENLARTAETLQLDPDASRPRILLVSTIGGGVGSGMTLDLAYTLRLMLAERGITDSEIIGMLMFGTNAMTRDPSLCTANGFAFLTELRHFIDNGYPGDERLGIPAFEDEPPFDSTYFLDSGPISSSADMDRRLNDIAEYMCLSSTSGCASFFDACRDLEQDSESFDLRTFGLSLCGPGNQTGKSSSVDQLAYAMLQSWLNGSGAPDAAEDFLAQQLRQLPLEADAVNQLTHDAIDQFRTWNDLSDIVAQISFEQPSQDIATRLSAEMDGLLDQLEDERTIGRQPEFAVKMEQFLARRGETVGQDLSTAILNLLMQTPIEFGRYEACLSHCRKYVQDQIDQRKSEQQDLLKAIAQAKNQLVAGPQFDDRGQPTGPAMTELASQYIQLRQQEFMVRYMRQYYQIIQTCLQSTREMLDKFRFQVESVAKKFQQGDDSNPETQSRGSTIETLMIESALRDFDTLVQYLKTHVEQDLLAESEGFLNVCSSNSLWQQRLPAAVRHAAQTVLGNAFKKISIDAVIAENRIPADMVSNWINEQMNHTQPKTSDCGGALRMLAAMPRHSGESMIPKLIQDSFGLNLASINGTPGDVVLCVEGEGISLANVAFKMMQSGPEAIELAKRIHCRNDVQFTSLDDLL